MEIVNELVSLVIENSCDLINISNLWVCVVWVFIVEVWGIHVDEVIRKGSLNLNEFKYWLIVKGLIWSYSFKHIAEWLIFRKKRLVSRWNKEWNGEHNHKETCHSSLDRQLCDSMLKHSLLRECLVFLFPCRVCSIQHFQIYSGESRLPGVVHWGLGGLFQSVLLSG